MSNEVIRNGIVENESGEIALTASGEYAAKPKSEHYARHVFQSVECAQTYLSACQEFAMRDKQRRDESTGKKGTRR